MQTQAGLDVSRPKRQRKPKAAKGKDIFAEGFKKLGEIEKAPLVTFSTLKDAATAFDKPSNPSGIWPTEFNVLVLQKKVDEKSAGGIIIPDIAKDREQYAEMEGTLIATSPLAFTFERWPEGSRKPQPGDKVIIAKYSGTRVVGKDGQTYLLTKDKDLSAIREA
jgi:chaperonin GroES